MIFTALLTLFFIYFPLKSIVLYGIAVRLNPNFHRPLSLKFQLYLEAYLLQTKIIKKIWIPYWVAFK